jgi:hypothetical protein
MAVDGILPENQQPTAMTFFPDASMSFEFDEKTQLVRVVTSPVT